MAKQSVEISSDVIVVKTDDDFTLLNVETGTFYRLSGTSVRLWTLLAESTNIDDAVTTFNKEYEIDSLVLRNDLKEFIDSLKEAGLINVMCKMTTHRLPIK